jgi:hypothetical protein
MDDGPTTAKPPDMMPTCYISAQIVNVGVMKNDENANLLDPSK